MNVNWCIVKGLMVFCLLVLLYTFNDVNEDTEHQNEQSSDSRMASGQGGVYHGPKG